MRGRGSATPCPGGERETILCMSSKTCLTGKYIDPLVDAVELVTQCWTLITTRTQGPPPKPSSEPRDECMGRGPRVAR